MEGSVEISRTRDAPAGDSGVLSAPPAGASSAGTAGGGLWQRLLREHLPQASSSSSSASSSSSSRDLAMKNHLSLLVLGHRGSGARSLIARLAGKDPADAPKGFAMEYEYVNLRSKDDDGIVETVGVMDVWHMECPEFGELLTVPLSSTADALATTVVMIVVDLSCPHIIASELEKWEAILTEHICTGIYSHDGDLKQRLQQKTLVDLAVWQLTERRREQRAAAGDASEQPSSVLDLDAEGKLPARAEDAMVSTGMLQTNWGVPVVVVGTKSETLDAALMKQTSSFSSTGGKVPKHSLANFIQMYLRRWCIANGAALVYTSAHNNVNCEWLLQYLKHRALGFPPVEKLTSKPEAIAIPFGADSITEVAKLSIETVAPAGMDTPFSAVFKPVEAEQAVKSGPTGPVPPVDHQAFLQRQQELLQRKQRDGDLFKAIPLPHTSAGKLAIGVPSKTEAPSKDSPVNKTSKKVEQDAEKFFNTMLKNYKK
eukprot:RCo037900